MMSEKLTLEIGCGDKKVKNIGIDIRKTPFTTVLASCEFLPFSDSVFDKVSARMALEHLNNPVVAILEAKRVLKVQGEFEAVVPKDSKGTIYQLKQILLLRLKGSYRFYKDVKDGAHKWQFHVKGTKVLFEELGFRNVKVYLKMIFPYVDGDMIIEGIKNE
jgi:ubiquinone/menaquinone biosynthesis C-methylase UbiE